MGGLRHERFYVFGDKSESHLKERKLGIKGRNFYENRFQSCESEMKVLVTQFCLCDSIHCSRSMEFTRQEYLSGLPFPSPGDFSDSGIKPGSPALQADSLLSEPPGRIIASVIN